MPPNSISFIYFITLRQAKIQDNYYTCCERQCKALCINIVPENIGKIFLFNQSKFVCRDNRRMKSSSVNSWLPLNLKYKNRTFTARRYLVYFSNVFIIAIVLISPVPLQKLIKEKKFAEMINLLGTLLIQEHVSHVLRGTEKNIVATHPF